MAWSRCLGVVLALAMLGCGGNGPAIEHRVGMEKLWHTPVDGRQGVLDAFRGVYVTHATLDHNRFLLRDAKSEAAIARAERKRASQGVHIAKLEKERRAAGYFAKLADVAARQMEASAKEEATLQRKISWLDAHIDYLEAEVAYLAAEGVAAEARFELAKAELAVDRGFAAKDFNVAPFTEQVRKTEARAAAKLRSAEEARQRAQHKHSAWQPDGP